jgi:S1-C subfamily serine protease
VLWLFIAGTVTGADIPEIVAKAKPAVVQIISTDLQDNTRTGTGFFFHADGSLVTNFHVIAFSINSVKDTRITPKHLRRSKSSLNTCCSGRLIPI